MSAWTFVFASGWGLRRLAETGAPKLGGVIFAGPGIGILLAGVLGSLIGRWGADAAWIGYGLAALLLSAWIWRVFDDGHRRRRRMAPCAGAPPLPATAAAAATRAGWSRSMAWPASATSSRPLSCR